MRDTTTDLLSRIETLEARLRILEATQSPPADVSVKPTPEHSAAEPSSRRDLFRYGAAVLGAAATGMAASTVEAADGGPVIIGGFNTGNGGTYLTTSATSYGLEVVADNAAYGLVAVSAGIGAYGGTGSTSIEDAGVRGHSGSVSGQAPGVYGIAYSPYAPAVYGRSAGGGNAVRAEVPANTGGNVIALYALNYSTYTGPGPGAGGFAVYGLSAKGHGLVGATAAAGAAAVVGATNSVAGAYAGAFYGPVIVGGNFTVVGGAKSAAVPHPDGSHRRLYCVESPESWFEDFGEGALKCGEASIALDPDFASVVEITKYHVFLSGYQGQSELSVFDRSPDGFRVRGSEGAEGTFSWRVVAKRKDIAAPRFETVEIPEAPTLPDVPDSATATEPPRVPPFLGRPK